MGLASYLAQIKLAYGIGKWPAILFITLPTLLYAPTNFIAVWLHARMRINSVLYLAAAMQLAGTWLRCLSFIGDPEGKFWILMMGTFVFFLPNPLILNMTSKIANLWFAQNEIARATAISGLMAPLGSLLGLALTGVIATGVNVDDPVDCMNRL